MPENPAPTGGSSNDPAAPAATRPQPPPFDPDMDLIAYIEEGQEHPPGPDNGHR